MSHEKRHAVLTCGFNKRFDKRVMLRTLARLRGSALRGRALGRALFIAMLAIALGFAAPEKIDSAKADLLKPVDTFSLKLYLYNQTPNWEQFECAHDLAMKESSWRYTAVNDKSGAYGLFQSMSDYAPTWDPYEQIDKAKIYIESRYDGSWCKAYKHLVRFGWH